MNKINPASDLSELDYQPSPIFRPQHKEDTLTRILEQQTAKIPSDVFLFLGLGAMAASLAFELVGRERQSRFVGMWPPSLLILGLYNKLVKTVGTR
jgi:hypothetical protein